MPRWWSIAAATGETKRARGQGRDKRPVCDETLGKLWSSSYQ